MRIIYCSWAVLLLISVFKVTEGAQRRVERATSGGNADGFHSIDREGTEVAGRRRKHKAGEDASGEERRSGKRRRKKVSQESIERLTDVTVPLNGEPPEDLSEYSSQDRSDRGYEFLSKGELDRAIEIFSETGDNYGLSLSYTSGPHKDFKRALNFATAALKDNPSIPAIYYQRSRLAGFLGHWEALDADIHALIGLGADLSTLESHAESFRLSMYCSASLKMHEILMDLTSDPARKAKYYMNMGLCYEEQGETEMAYNFLIRAVRMNENSVDAAFTSRLRK